MDTSLKAPKPTNINLFRPHQIVDYEDDIKAAQSQLENPRIQDKGSVRKRLRALQHDLETQCPEPVTDGATRDALAKREKELLEQITPGMLSQEEMRKCGPTAVDRHMRWEKGNLEKIKEWKNIRLQLAADTSHPSTWGTDIANLEQYRPEGREQGIRLDSLIPGIHAMSPQAKENWPLGEPTIETPAKQAARRLSKEAKRSLSEKMKAIWAERKAAPVAKE